MLNLKYHSTTSIWLKLEEYYNAGLTPEKAKEIIQNTCDFKVVESGFNSNFIIENMNLDGDGITKTIIRIRKKLDAYMDTLKTTKVKKILITRCKDCDFITKSDLPYSAKCIKLNRPIPAAGILDDCPLDDDN